MPDSKPVPFAFSVDAQGNGVAVQAKAFHATAATMDYDEGKGMLVLNGTDDSPATLFLMRTGSPTMVRAKKICFSTKTEKLHLEAGSKIRTE
jgi:hypothetical protein